MKEIKRINDNYTIDNYGNVYNKKGEKIKAFKRNGYLSVDIYNVDGSLKKMTVTRLLAECFLGAVADKNTVFYTKNGNNEDLFVGTKENNYKDGNIAFGTRKDMFKFFIENNRNPNKNKNLGRKRKNKNKNENKI